MEGRVGFGVLGPVVAWDGSGDAIALKGPRHRAVLARLIVARRRVVPVSSLVEDLWEDPPEGAVGAVRTFVAALRRALEPGRPPRSPARLLVTEGPGYALRAEPSAVDAWRFERAVADAVTMAPAEELARLEEALGWWRGPAYADFADEYWARTERSRLAELRLHAVERRAAALLALGRAAEAVPDLDAHAAEHPWREEAWRLLALALYRAGRQGDALAVLRRARSLLVEQLGVDPGPALRRLEADILHQAPHLAPAPSPGQSAGGRLSRGPGGGRSAEQVWAEAAAAYDSAVTSGARARLESTMGLLRSLAVTGAGGLQAARRHRVAAVEAAAELGDPELTARVIGAYDVPAIWTRVDDPEQTAQILAAAERALTALTALTAPTGAAGPAALPAPGHEAARVRLLATIAVESRGGGPSAAGTSGHGLARSGDGFAGGGRPARGREAAEEAERLARRLDDPALLAFALNGAFMQTFHRAGLADHRDRIGAELVLLSARHGLVTSEVLGHLVRLQARCALADFRAADDHAAAADRLAERHELPLVGVFTQWYRALRLAATGHPPGDDRGHPPRADRGHPTRGDNGPVIDDGGRPAQPTEVEAAYRDAAARLEGAGMPGMERGLLPLALLCLRVRDDQPAPTEEDIDWGPYEPWVRPLVLLAQGRRDLAATALREAPEPPGDLLLEALWCLTARAAVALGDRETMERAHAALLPAKRELAGAGSGVLTVGPVSAHLAALATALSRETSQPHRPGP
ncbi:winged helix-turn-helix domain-containing protein [Nonomuraea sp. SMC257]|uniref:Winged helix-turn-helix domain-containing protein n=1 Tax=Nonomuraea montanisoli TaxID=2741721 RepID=A0A7Y6M2V6_9ACTN|nr:winged helix-turn-helix domain-containing protein [Nonomuraea montanisoli]